MEFDFDAVLAGIVDAPAPKAAISTDDFNAFFTGMQAPTVGDDLPEDDEGPEPEEPKTIAKKGSGVKRVERNRRNYEQRSNAYNKRKIENIAVLDMETDPFDNVNETGISPFLAVLYSDNFEPKIIWEENAEAFADKVISTIEELEEPYTIYAHNGGKFDYMFLMKRLKGHMMFKGRGIMTAQIGKHELRDSFHIIPDRLANFKKDHIDYNDMTKARRHAHKDEIIKYCISDCKYLLDIVKGFASRFGLKLSIGQAAMARIRADYKFERLSESQDAFFRDFFFGGRVECIQGKTKRSGEYKLFDVNSMYPAVMAQYEHPIGNFYLPTSVIMDDTIFIDLTCDSKGAFVMRDGETTTAPHGRYRFKTTIWEYRVAKKHNLISNEEIHECISMPLRTTFEKFVAPLYNERQHLKARLNDMRAQGKKDTPEYDELVKDDMFMKFLLNNGYGKFAQNPRKYKENYITMPHEIPEGGAEAWGNKPAVETDDYWIWQRPSPSDRFNNVATGASITGAARSVLLDAIYNAIDPIYCDTDSLICRELTGVKIHKTDLGAWDMEAEMSEVIINGKKLYGYIKNDGTKVTKAKGAGSILEREQWAEVEKIKDEKRRNQKVIDFSYDNMNALFAGATIINKAKGVTLTKTGNQFYMGRRISATASERMNPDGNSTLWRFGQSS